MLRVPEVLSTLSCLALPVRERQTGKGPHDLFSLSCIRENMPALVPCLSCWILTWGRVSGDQKHLKKSICSAAHSMPKPLSVLPLKPLGMHQAWFLCDRCSNKQPGERSLPLWGLKSSSREVGNLCSYPNSCTSYWSPVHLTDVSVTPSKALTGMLEESRK